jgi:maleate isomerase
MIKPPEVTMLETKLDDVLARLLRATGGSRSTLRIDDPARGWNVDFVCAEAVNPGVKSLRGDGSIDQRAADTVKWMVQHRRNLVQPDLTRSPVPAPPAALMSAYAAKAQLLGPLLAKDGHLSGWISVHYVESTHAITPDQEQAMDRARAEVALLTGIGSK